MNSVASPTRSMAVRLLLITVLGIFGSAPAYATNLTTFTRPLTFHTSQLACNITQSVRSMCVLTNAYYWKSQLYFLSDDPSQVKLYIPHFRLPYGAPMPGGVVKVVNKTQLRQIFTFPNNTLVADMLSFSEGITYHRLYEDNFYHTFWEGVSNLHVLACKFFGRCDYDPNATDLQVVFFDRGVVNMSLPHAQLSKCITNLPSEEWGNPHLLLPVRIKTATLGLGPEAFGQHNVVGRRSTPSEPLRSSWVRRMRACMGLTQAPQDVAALKSHVLTIIQRPRGHRGRAISNVEEVAEWVSELMPGFEVQIVRMEGKTLEEQAAVWNNSTVVMSTHGAQLSNAIYLPNNSFVLEVDQWGMLKQKFYKLFVIQPVGPYVNLGHAFVSPTSIKSVNVSRFEALKGDGKFAQLTPEQQQEWFKLPACDYKWLDPQARCMSNWVKFFTDVHLLRSEVESSLTAARKWLREHGVAVPEPTSPIKRD